MTPVVVTPTPVVTTPAPAVTPAVPATTPAEVVAPSVVVTTPAVTVAPVAAYNFTKALGVGSVGTEVRELQKMLKDAGYFKYPSITGYFGAVTKNALSAYQKANSLSATGNLDSATRAVLNGGVASVSVTPATTPVVATGYVFKSNLYLGASGEAVRMLQQKLKDFGYFTHPTITGFYGPATRAAVVKFQQDRDLKPYPGWVGPGTRSALNAL